MNKEMTKVSIIHNSGIMREYPCEDYKMSTIKNLKEYTYRSIDWNQVSEDSALYNPQWLALNIFNEKLLPI